MGKILFLLFFANCCYGQGILKRLPKPTSAMLTKAKSTHEPVTISAWRLTAPIAGYMYPQNMIVTGIGYGYQRLHWVDSTQKWYTNYSISGVVYAGGNVMPSLSPNNIVSIGVSFGAINQILMIGPTYNLPKDNTKGSIGVVFSISMPLNN